jgi:hypothetical protein
MTAPTLKARKAARDRILQQQLERARANASRTGRSLVCSESPDIRRHETCVGLTAMKPLGCLCECHDEGAS